jgi:hypothetical protein
VRVSRKPRAVGVLRMNCGRWRDPWPCRAKTRTWLSAGFKQVQNPLLAPEATRRAHVDSSNLVWFY